MFKRKKKKTGCETPCGYCTKWDKKCDKKVGCGDEKPQRGLRAEAGIFYDDAISMPGLQAMLKGERFNDIIKIHFEGEYNNDKFLNIIDELKNGVQPIISPHDAEEGLK